MAAQGNGETGFGAPSGDGNLGGVFDWGFGDATPVDFNTINSVDLGFGSQPTEITTLLIEGGAKRYPDDGGEVLVLRGALQSDGPFRVQLENANAVMFPGSASGCFAASAGAGETVTANLAKDRVQFALPPLPTGLYTPRVQWGQLFAESVDGEQILVLRRDRPEVDYRVRRRFPRDYPVGVGLPSLEPEVLE